MYIIGSVMYKRSVYIDASEKVALIGARIKSLLEIDSMKQRSL
jgi:hypothetical protein